MYVENSYLSKQLCFFILCFFKRNHKEVHKLPQRV